MCYADFKMLYSKKSHSLKISENGCIKNLEMIESKLFMNVKKNYKTFCQTSFCVFGGAPLNASKHTKAFFREMFNYLFSMFMNNAFSINSRFFTQKMSNYVISHFKAF